MLASTLRSAALVLALPFPQAAEPARQGGTEEDFEKALALVDRMIAGDDAKKAKDLLLATIAQSREKPWALYHLTEIVDDLRRATFWSRNVKPDPKSLVSGELLAWSASSGQIKVRYRPDAKPAKTLGIGPKSESKEAKLPAALEDFDKIGSTLVHPIAFEGPYTIEIEGDSYPVKSGTTNPPGVVVCSNWERSTVISFGSPPVREGTTYHFFPARILSVEGGEVTTEDETGMEQIPSGAFELKVVVGPSTITVYSSGKKILTGKKPASIYGRFALLNLPAVNEIRFNGKAQPSWLQGVVDAGVQERWVEFEKGYKPADDLPEWLRAKAWGSVGGRAWNDESVPGAADPSDKDCVQGFLAKLKEKGAEAALDRIRSTAGMSMRPELNSWLTALALRLLGRQEEALEMCARVCATDQRFLPARRMAVELNIDTAGASAALAECKKVVSDFPDEPKAYYDLAELELLEGRPENARGALRTAIDAGVPAGTLEDAQHLVVRAIRGPLWPRAFEYKTRNYVVRSDIDQATCFEAATLLEKFNAKFNIHLRRLPGQETKVFRVFLFSGQEGYLGYTRDLLGREKRNTAGLYSPVVKQLLIWNLPDVEQMMRTVRHEGFHQYFDALVHSSPVWFNEGLAEYYEGSKLVKGAWSDGEINPGHLATLRKDGIVPWKDFLQVQPWTFYSSSNVERCYAQAWAMVHFLQNGGKEPKKRFDALLDALVEGARPKDAVARVFDEASLPALEKEFQEYVNKLE